MYLIDTNVFLQANNLYYPPDVCPGFWDWLDAMVDSSKIFTIDRVVGEVMAKDDYAKDWLSKHLRTPFIVHCAASADDVISFQAVEAHVNSTPYSDSKKEDFLEKADAWLVSKARLMQATVVTQEGFEAVTKKIRIPGICRGMSVPCINTLELMRQLRLQLVMAS